MIIARALVGTAIALGIAAGITTPASAEPSPFGTLGCSCKPPASIPDDNTPGSDQTNRGIQSGLDYLHADSPRRPDF